MANTQKSVELVIRARDESKRVLDSARTALDRFTAAQAKTGARRDLLAAQEKSARDLGAAYFEAAESAEALGRKLAAAKRPSAALKQQFDQARAAARRARLEFDQALLAGARSRGKTGTPGSFAAFDQKIVSAAGARQAAAATNALGDALARVAAYQQRKARFAAFDQVASGAVRAEASIETMTAATQRNTAALTANGRAAGLAGRQAAAWSTRQGRGPLGLRPFELQNLSYQINDVFTQIASGTPVMQVAAQQGGQFIQLFPKLGGALLRAVPMIGLVTTALSPFISAMKDANDEAGNLEAFEQLLTRSGDGAAYDAQQLSNLAEELDGYRGSIKDARAALTEFVGDSVAPEYLERFGKTALDFAQVMKVDVADASKTVSDAFTGNADAILALDDELNFLTDSERDHVKALRQSKKDAEARTYAFEIFARKYGETAAKMRGSWSQILSNFGKAWKRFVDYVNFIDFSKIRSEINGLMTLIARLTGQLADINGSTEAELVRFIETQKDIEYETEHRGRPASNLDVIGNIANQVRRGRAQNRRRAAEAELARLRADAQPTSDPSDTTLDPPEPANTDDGRDRDAERRAQRQRDFVEGLAAENAQRRFQIALIDQEERERQILEAIREKELAAGELGLELSDKQRAAIRETVGALYDAEKAHEALRLIEQARLDLAEARGEVENKEDFVARKIREAGLYTNELNDATGAVVVTVTREGQEYASILRQLYDINEAARQRQAVETQVNDLLSLRSGLMDQIEFYEDAGEQATADRLREQLDGVNERLLAATDSAINFWTAMGGEGAEAALARLGQLRDQLNGIGQNAVVSGRQINEMLADGGVDAFDQFAQSIANGVNAITAFRDAFLQFAADFLRQIAQMILKQALLNALQGSDKGKGGGVGGAIAAAVSGLFRHSGGMVGQGGGYKPVPLAAFAAATRYHTGGIAGFKPNEVPAVLLRNEEVLTEDDPRHRSNLGGGGKSVKVVNVFDPADALERALSTERGERVFVNFVRKNSGVFKAALG